MIVHGHMIHRKCFFLIRQQRRFQGSQRSKRPASAKRSLIADLRCTSLFPVIVRSRQNYILRHFTVPDNRRTRCASIILCCAFPTVLCIFSCLSFFLLTRICILAFFHLLLLPIFSCLIFFRYCWNAFTARKADWKKDRTHYSRQSRSHKYGNGFF